jgi:hypothetical protein
MEKFFFGDGSAAPKENNPPKPSQLPITHQVGARPKLVRNR